MANLTINNFWGGIWDDPFLARDWECLDMDWIDIRTTPRKISCDESFLWSYASSSLVSNDTLSYVTETSNGIVQSYWSNCYINSASINALVAGADRHITVGSNNLDYNLTTNPEGVRHIFFTYDNATNPIKVVWYVGWVYAIIAPTASTSGWAAPANIPSSRATAVCYLWAGAVLFARGNRIYEYNPSTQTLAAGGFKIELPIGAIVKNIYYFWGLIQIVYTIYNDTYIHGCSYNGTTYTLNTYADKTAGEKCLSSTVANNIIYWISTNGIFAFSWSSQLVKKYTFSSSAICSYNKWILRIADATSFYEYGANKPWYGSPFTKKTSSIPIVWITETRIVTLSGITFRLDVQAWAYKATNYYTTHPYTAGLFWQIKKWSSYHIGYTLPKTYTDSSILCSIVVSIQTNETYASNTATFHTIATISDANSTYIDIMPNMINKALETAWFSSNFWWIKFKLTLNAWDPYSAYGNTLFRKTPEVFDIYLYHDEILNSLQ